MEPCLPSKDSGWVCLALVVTAWVVYNFFRFPVRVADFWRHHPRPLSSNYFFQISSMSLADFWRRNFFPQWFSRFPVWVLLILKTCFFPQSGFQDFQGMTPDPPSFQSFSFQSIPMPDAWCLRVSKVGQDWGTWDGVFSCRSVALGHAWRLRVSEVGQGWRTWGGVCGPVPHGHPSV